jgi:hypothetical protein
MVCTGPIWDLSTIMVCKLLKCLLNDFGLSLLSGQYTIGRYNEVLAAVSYFHLLSARTTTVAYETLHISSLHCNCHYGFEAMHGL